MRCDKDEDVVSKNVTEVPLDIALDRLTDEELKEWIEREKEWMEQKEGEWRKQEEKEEEWRRQGVEFLRQQRME